MATNNQTDPNLVKPKGVPEPTAAELNEQQRKAFGIVRGLLYSAPQFCTKALPGGDLMELPDHGDFRPADTPDESLAFVSPFEKGLKGADIDRLLALEEKLMVQLERLDGLERAFQNSEGSSAKLVKYLESAAEDLDALFDQTLRDVKAKDRPLERAAWSFRAFMEESRLAVASDKAKLIHVLNVKGEDLADHPHFGIGHRFGPIKELPRVRDDVYGLWVLDTKVLNSGQASTIGLKAYNHTAMAIMNVDAETEIESRFFRDSRGDIARLQELKTKDYTETDQQNLQYARSPVTDKELAWLNQCVGNVPGLERVVLCFSPLRVREASRYEQQLGDVFVPSSYAYAGKLAFVALVSREDGIATPVAQLNEKYGVSSRYAVESGNPKRQPNDNGPSLFDHNGALGAIPSGIVAMVKFDGAGEKLDKYASVFMGLHTARGKGADYQVATELSFDYLRRILTVLARSIVGAPLSQAMQIRKDVEELLHHNLRSRGADDTQKPFPAIEVILDQSSPEGRQAQANGGIRLIVKPKGRTAISDVWINIMPTKGESDTNATAPK